MTSVLISICIPSFNQRDALKVTLASLENIDIKYRHQVEILISDNGSLDDSVIISEEFMTSNKMDTYLLKREDGTQGSFCENLIELIRNANGSYIWFVGCGEHVLVNRIGGLLRVLETEQPSNLVLSSSTYESQPKFLALLTDLESDALELSSTPSTGVVTGKACIPFDHSVSCNITRKEVYLIGGIQQLGPEVRWPHIESMFRFMVAKGFYSIKVEAVTILVHQPTSGWYSSQKNWSIYLELCRLYSDYVKQLNEVKSAWSSDMEILCRNLVSKRSLWLIFSFRQLGQPPRIAEFLELVRTYSRHSMFNSILLVFVLVLPKNIIRVIRRLATK